MIFQTSLCLSQDLISDMSLSSFCERIYPKSLFHKLAQMKIFTRHHTDKGINAHILDLFFASSLDINWLLCLKYFSMLSLLVDDGK